MEKRMVYVVIIDVDEDQEKSVEQSFCEWKHRAEGAYAAKIKLDRAV